MAAQYSSRQFDHGTCCMRQNYNRNTGCGYLKPLHQTSRMTLHQTFRMEQDEDSESAQEEHS